MSCDLHAHKTGSHIHAMAKQGLSCLVSRPFFRCKPRFSATCAASCLPRLNVLFLLRSQSLVAGGFCPSVCRLRWHFLVCLEVLVYGRCRFSRPLTLSNPRMHFISRFRWLHHRIPVAFFSIQDRCFTFFTSRMNGNCSFPPFTPHDAQQFFHPQDFFVFSAKRGFRRSGYECFKHLWLCITSTRFTKPERRHSPPTRADRCMTILAGWQLFIAPRGYHESSNSFFGVVAIRWRTWVV